MIDNLKMHDRRTPRCTGKAEYNLWRKSYPVANYAGLCEDCTPAYQLRMEKRGLCDHPEILFYVDKEGRVYGSEKPREDMKAL